MKRHSCRGPESDYWIPDWVFVALVFLAITAFAVNKWDQIVHMQYDRHAEQFMPKLP